MTTHPPSGNPKLIRSGHVHSFQTDCSLVLLLLLLFGCTGADTDKPVAAYPLYSGVWFGDVSPAGSAPFGALFHVVVSDDGTTIHLESQYIQQTFTSLETAGDSLHFIWPMTTPRDCVLIRLDDLGWQGDCHADETNPIGLLLVPPTRSDIPTGVARAAIGSDIPWIEERVGQIHILVQSGGTAASHAAQLRESAVEAFDSAFELLDEMPPDVPFRIFYVDSRSEMRQLLGWPAGGWADGVARTALNTVTDDGRTPDRHEIMHVAATAAWGVPATPWEWINEGLATYAPGECAGIDIHSLVAALTASGSAVPLHRLIDNFRELDEVSAYLQSASVTGYIHELYGIGAVRSIWQNGPAAIPDVTGMDIDSLEHDWREFVTRFPTATSGLESVYANGCL